MSNEQSPRQRGVSVLPLLRSADVARVAAAALPSRRLDMAALADVEIGREEPEVTIGGSAAAYRVACRLFPGFHLVPEPLLAAIGAWAPVLDGSEGRLSLREREVIARAIARSAEDESTPASGSRQRTRRAGQRPAVDGPGPWAKVRRRERALAAFVRRLTDGWMEVRREDLEAALSAGWKALELREAARTASVYRLLAYLAAAPGLEILRHPELVSLALPGLDRPAH